MTIYNHHFGSKLRTIRYRKRHQHAQPTVIVPPNNCWVWFKSLFGK